MSHTVLDGSGNLKHVYSIGSGTSNEPIRIATMPYQHAVIEDGKVFQHIDRHSITNNGVFNYLIKTPASPAHVELLRLAATSKSSPVYVDLFENGVVSANGTSESLFNLNRQSTTAPQTLLYMAPTVTSDGPSLMQGESTGDKNVGGLVDWDSRMILKPSTNYLVRYQNVSGATAVVSLTIVIGED